nr:hypothetical protein StreXyl84_78930 [Streptomyces sp. Xyl84]
MAGKREEDPAGSSNNLRGDVLRVLGVLKVAPVEQIPQITEAAPHLLASLVTAPSLVLPDQCG